jgi:hypothetical protein
MSRVVDPPTSRRKVMRTLGYVAAVAMTAAGAGLGVLAVKSLPDVRRYLAMRKMLRPEHADMADSVVPPLPPR